MTVNWKNVRLIFHREVRDQLRDRRTLFMILVLPMLLYPAMGVGMVHLTMVFAEQPRTVVLLGAADLPGPPLLDGERFVADWFRSEDQARKLRVVSDLSIREAPPGPRAAADAVLVAQGEAIRDKLGRKTELDREAKRLRSQAAPRGPGSEGEPLVAVEQELRSLQAELTRLFADSQMQVLVCVPPQFAANLARVDEQLAQRGALAIVDDYPRPVIVHNNADEKSLVAYNRVRDALDRWEDQILRQRLAKAGLPPSLPSPIQPIAEDLATETQLDAIMWSKLFPALLVIMAVTGAFYPSIDLGAGEKERGTMETLLICPARRTEIVLGKFFTVMSFSIVTAVLNLASMGLTSHHAASMIGQGPLGNGNVPSPPSPAALGWMCVFLVPLAALFSALCLSLATFARSSKEGQYYLTPLLMVTLGLTIFCLSPGVEITPFHSVMPVVGVSLLLKGLLLNPQDVHLYWYTLPVMVSTCVFSGLALWWAIDQFQREDVLFREAERFDVRLWVRHLLRDKESTPSFAEAGCAFVMIMLLQFAALNAISRVTAGTGQGALDLAAALRVMLIQQVAIIAAPPLLMGIMLTSNLRETFRLRWPGWGACVTAAGLAVALHPLAIELAASLSPWFPPLPDNIRMLLQGISDARQPVWFVLLAFAVAPAICEELAFRGFILSGFSRSGRTWLGIVLSSLAFGIMHMIPQQVFNASLLGVVLGTIAWRTGSLWPCMVFHATFNALAVLHGRWSAVAPTFENPFVVVAEGMLRYRLPTLLLAALLVISGFRNLTRVSRGGSGGSARPGWPWLRTWGLGACERRA